jgi:two-component system, NtrC family, sensor kinase
MSNRSITFGLVIVFLSLATLILGVGWLGIHAMNEQNSEARNIRARQWEDVRLSSEVLDYSNRNNQINIRIFLGDDRSELNRLVAERTENSAKISALLAILGTRVDSPEEQNRLDAVLASRKSYQASYQYATKLLLLGHKLEAQEFLTHDTLPRLQIYRSAVRDYADFQTREMSEQLESSTSRYRRAHQEVVGMMIVSLLLALAIAAFVIRRIVIEMRHREKAESNLRQLNSELEIKIRERTASLKETNRSLSAEIAERKQKDALVHRLSAAVEQSPASVVITDLSGRIVYVNRKFLELTGYCRDEVVGQNPRILKSGQTKPEAYQQLWHSITAGKEWRGEFCNRKKNGDLYWEYGLICPIREEDSRISHYLAIKEDITERKRAEKELRLTWFSLENAADGVLWVDPQAHILYANDSASRVLGLSRQELTSLAIPDIDPNFPRERWSDFWQELKRRRSLTFETQGKHKEGRLLSIEVTASYLEFDGQEYLFGFARDISERRMIQAQLQQAQKMESIGQLAAGIAHEINTPTQFVTDNLTFLRDSCTSVNALLDLYRGTIHDNSGALPPSAVSKVHQAESACDLDFIMAEAPSAIDQALDGAHRVAKIVRAMKEFSHPGSDEKQPADINQAVLTTLTVSRNEWKYVAEVETILQPDLQMVPCHISELNQVLLNLLINSAHAIAEVVGDGATKKGKITIRTTQDAQSTTIAVQDTGAGIRPEIQSRVFDLFFTTKGIGRGSGQGLFLAHNSIVKKHGGKIWFDTEVGKGTTFFIQLPTAGETGTYVETHSVRR